MKHEKYEKYKKMVIARYMSRVREAVIPEHIRKAIEEDLRRLRWCRDADEAEELLRRIERVY